MSWIETFTGKKIHPLHTANHLEQPIDLNDIAHALSQTCRFGGHTKEFYSVAQHACLVSYLAPDKYALAALHHDDTEAYLGDVVSPVKKFVYFVGIEDTITDHGDSSISFCQLEEELTKKIFAALSLGDYENALRPEVKRADKAALYFEQSVLMRGEVEYDTRPTEEMIALLESKGISLGKKFRCWSPKEAKMKFLMQHQHLLGAK